MPAAAARKIKTVKTANRKEVLEIFRGQADISATDIAAHVHLSIPTIMKILDYLVKKGFILPVGKGASTEMGGKRPGLFRLNERLGTAIGIHLTPTAMICIMTDLRMHTIARKSTTIKPDEALASVVGKMARAVKDLLAKTDAPESLIGIGLAVPAVVDGERGLMRMSPHFPSWGLDVGLSALLQERIGLKVPVAIDNETRFEVVAEKEFGLAKGKHHAIALHAATGVAAGVLLHGRIMRGVHHLAGEIGHMIIAPHDKTRCNCGGHGCFEVMIAPQRLLKTARQLGRKQRTSLLHRTATQDDITLEDIFEAANQGDSCARQALDEVIGWFAVGISNLIMMYDPEVIILNGPYTRAGDYFLGSLRKRINTVALAKITKEVEIAYTPLGADVAVIGAANYIIGEYFRTLVLDK